MEERGADRVAARFTGVALPESRAVGAAPQAGAAVGRLGAGEQVAAAVRAPVAAAFGHDFGQVRVHRDDAAAAVAAGLGAAAFTWGDHIVFGKGAYAPHHAAGRALLAHELMHVVQQRHAAPRIALKPKTAIAPTPTLPSIDIAFDDRASRWLVTIGGIPVAEVSSVGKDARIEIIVTVEPGAVDVLVRHPGTASLAAVADPRASLGIPVRLREIEVGDDPSQNTRKGANQSPDRPPSVPRYTVEGGAPVPLSTVEMPKGNVPWLRPRGEGEAVAETEPLTEWEDSLRKHPDRIRGVIVDPENVERVIGYRLDTTAGLTRIVDRDGEVVFDREIGIETPLLDPLDFIPTPGSIGKVATGVGGRIVAKSVGKKAAASALTLPAATISRLRRIAIAISRRGARKAAEQTPSLVLRITEHGVVHSFDRHAVQWFGRTVSKATHLRIWQELIERVAVSKQVFRWSLKDAPTIAHLGRVDGKYFVVQFFEETGELATAFVPDQSQLARMLTVVRGAP